MLRARSASFRARDTPEEAQRELDSCAWPAPEVEFHIQHWYELRGRAELALYQQRGVEALELMNRSAAGLHNSRLLAVQDVRTDWYWARGRAAIAAAFATGDRSSIAIALRQVKRLDRERFGFATAYAHLLRAGAALARGDETAALTHLRDAETEAENSDLPMCAAAARRQRGVLLSGDTGAQLVTNADQWMSGHGIANPEQMTAALTATPQSVRLSAASG